MAGLFLTSCNTHEIMACILPGSTVELALVVKASPEEDMRAGDLTLLLARCALGELPRAELALVVWALESW